MRAGLSLKVKSAPSRAPAASTSAASTCRAIWGNSRSEVICGPKSESASTVSSSCRKLFFVTATRALGESPAGVLFRRIVPNALTPLIVQGTLGIGGAILDVAALSFLGLGAQLPTAEWGSMIGLERNSLFNAPHLILFPGIAIAITVLGFNLLGDGLRDALDPRLNR